MAYESRRAPYGRSPKSRIRREKCASEILVNGSKVARAHHKSKPQAAEGRLATAPALVAQAEFIA